MRRVPEPATPFTDKRAQDRRQSNLRVLFVTFLVVVLVFFLMKEREQIRDKMLRLAGRAHLTVTTQAIGETSQRISRYLLTIAFLNVCFGLLIGLGLFALQVP